MTVRKLPLYIEDTNYLLLGIHHSIETFQLAFFLNSFLGIQLQRTSEDVAKTSQEFFQVYEHEDVLRQQLRISFHVPNYKNNPNPAFSSKVLWLFVLGHKD